MKLLKRQMVGRASLTLLERRLVLAPEHLWEPVSHPQEPSQGQAQSAAA